MFSRDELLAAASDGATLAGRPVPLRFPGGAVDSRQVQRGELFVALRGQTTDGHRFIGNAVRAGAAAVLCERPDNEALAQGVPHVIVSNPLDVLQRLAHRRLRSQPYTRVIAITGSNGKTGAKDATAVLLQHLAPTLKTEGNLNTETGLPLTLLRLEPAHRFAVLEMGAQWVGEIASLCRIAPPDIAVVTVVGPEHLEFFGSLENVAQAEAEAVMALADDGIAILNGDDPSVRVMAARTTARSVLYGRRPTADVRALRVGGDPLTGLRFTISSGGERARVQLGMPGEHSVTTALAAAAVAVTCGMDVRSVATALGALRPAKRRGELKAGINAMRLVDDSYNANRQSAVAATTLLAGASIAKGARRWFVFGDMLELGTFAKEEHAAVGAAAAAAVDELVLVGSAVQATAEAALRAGMRPERVHLFAASLDQPAQLAAAREAAAALVRATGRAGDLVLIKGSLGVGMDAVVAALQEPHSATDANSHLAAPPPLPTQLRTRQR